MARSFRRVPFIPQLEVVECGAASLAMVMAYHGCEVDLQEVREHCGVSRDGVTAFDILTAAEGYGFATDAVRAGVDDLTVLPLPAVLHWNGNHFVVLERINSRVASILDPAVGQLKIPVVDLAQHFSGVALLFTPTASVARSRKSRSSLPGRLVRPVARNLVQVLLLSVLLQPFAVLLPVMTQLVIDRVSDPGEEGLALLVTAVIVAATVARLVLSLARSYVLQNVQAVSDVRMMGAFTRHLFSLPLKFFLARRPGDLLFRMNSNAVVQELMAGSVVSSVFDLFLVITYLALLLVYDIRAGSLIALFLVVRASVIQITRIRNRRLIQSELAASAAEGETFSEALAGFETVRATRSEEYLVDKWTVRTIGRWNWLGRRKNIDTDAEALLLFTDGLAVASLIVYAGLQVTDGSITIGSFALLLMLQMLIRQPLDGLLAAAQRWQIVSSHIARIDDVLQAKSESIDGKHLDLQGNVALENVSFRYGLRAPWVIRNVSLNVTAGERIAIIGRTGEGKSTIARLMLGLYSPVEGAIRFDGVDLRELAVAHLRRQIGVVVQEPFLFNDTVAYNISLGEETIDEAAIREAARIACIDDVIERLPQGYDSTVGENGRRLSGGERQRLAIARAVVRRPRLLLLDEATSALDLATERRVHENLDELQCTRIVIAHRPLAISGADRIIRVDRGQVVSDESWAMCAEAAR